MVLLYRLGGVKRCDGFVKETRWSEEVLWFCYRD